MDDVRRFMKKLLLVFSSLLMGTLCWSRQAMTPAPLNVRTVDGTVSNYPYQLKVPNASLADNADGTMTLLSTGAYISNSASLQSGATFFVSSGTVTTLQVSTISFSDSS